MKKLLNLINTKFHTTYESLVQFVNDHQDKIDNSNKLVMFVSCEKEEVIQQIIEILKENNFKVLGNINCEESEYQDNNIEDDNFDLELSFGGKYDFKVEEYGYDAISKLYFVYFYPLNETTLTYFEFYKKMFDKIIEIVSVNEVDLSYLLIDDYGYVNNEENLILTADFLDVNSLVNSVNIINKVISCNNQLKELEGIINYINLN